MSKGKWKPKFQLEPQPEVWSSPQALTWLLFKANKIKFGTNQYLEIANLIRSLLRQRAALEKKVDNLEAEVARLQKIKTRRAYQTEGDGEWSAD